MMRPCSGTTAGIVAGFGATFASAFFAAPSLIPGNQMLLWFLIGVGFILLSVFFVGVKWWYPRSVNRHIEKDRQEKTAADNAAAGPSATRKGVPSNSRVIKRKVVEEELVLPEDGAHRYETDE